MSQPPTSTGPSESSPEHLLPLVYQELRSLAAAMMARERRSHTLQATALVNEAYLRLVKGGQVRYEDRNHFFRVAAATIRRILVEHARARNADKRGGDRDRIPLDADGASPADAAPREGLDDAELLALDTAMKKLAAEEPRYAEVVELRFFAGLTAEQAAEVLGCSVETVHRDWRYAKARLRRWLSQIDEQH